MLWWIGLLCCIIAGIAIFGLVVLATRQSRLECVGFLVALVAAFGTGSTCYFLMYWEPVLRVVAAFIPAEGIALMVVVMLPALSAAAITIIVLAKILGVRAEDSTGAEAEKSENSAE